MMSGCHHQFFNIVIIKSLHALNSLAASVLAAEIIHCHTLDITQFCHSDHSIFPGNHVLHGNIKGIKTNRGSSVITIFIGNLQHFLTDHAKKKISVFKNCL